MIDRREPIYFKPSEVPVWINGALSADNRRSGIDMIITPRFPYRDVAQELRKTENLPLLYELQANLAGHQVVLNGLSHRQSLNPDGVVAYFLENTGIHSIPAYAQNELAIPKIKEAIDATHYFQIAQPQGREQVTLGRLEHNINGLANYLGSHWEYAFRHSISVGYLSALTVKNYLHNIFPDVDPEMFIYYEYVAYQAGLVHDIGKVIWPESTFDLKDRSPTIAKIHHTHCDVGEQMLDGLYTSFFQASQKNINPHIDVNTYEPSIDFILNILRDIKKATSTHHEYMDGSGYPRGLKGKEIGLIGRALAVADTWDAMRSPRGYRDGELVSIPEATNEHVKHSVSMDEIEATEKGRFDWDMVYAFHTISINELESLRDFFHRDPHQRTSHSRPQIPGLNWIRLDENTMLTELAKSYAHMQPIIDMMEKGTSLSVLKRG